MKKSDQIVCDDFDQVEITMQRLRDESPDLEVDIILSKGKYYIEEDVPLIRSWEKVIYTGKARNYKHKSKSK